MIFKAKEGVVSSEENGKRVPRREKKTKKGRGSGIRFIALLSLWSFSDRRTGVTDVAPECVPDLLPAPSFTSLSPFRIKMPDPEKVIFICLDSLFPEKKDATSSSLAHSVLLVVTRAVAHTEEEGVVL